MSETLWLGKVTPREWLKDGETISIPAAPARRESKLPVEVDLPPNRFGAGIEPGCARLSAFTEVCLP